MALLALLSSFMVWLKDNTTLSFVFKPGTYMPGFLILLLSGKFVCVYVCIDP